MANNQMPLKVSIDSTSAGILHKICKMKAKNLVKNFRNCETSAIAEILPFAARTGFSALRHVE